VITVGYFLRKRPMSAKKIKAYNDRKKEINQRYYELMLTEFARA